MDLCQFRDVLGVPREGMRAAPWRIQVPFGGPDLPMIDLFLTGVAAWALQRWGGRWFEGRAWWAVFLGLWGVGIVLHWLFCVDTGLFEWMNIG